MQDQLTTTNASAATTAQRISFGDISIGDRFHVGKSFGMGANSHVQSWLVYEKTGNSDAKVIEQHGLYRRQLGDTATFHRMARIFGI